MGGGRCRRGGKVPGAGGGTARTVDPQWASGATKPNGASPFAAWRLESILDTAFDCSAAWNAGAAGPHGAENQMAESGN